MSWLNDLLEQAPEDVAVGNPSAARQVEERTLLSELDAQSVARLFNEAILARMGVIPRAKLISSRSVLHISQGLGGAAVALIDESKEILGDSTDFAQVVDREILRFLRAMTDDEAKLVAKDILLQLSAANLQPRERLKIVAERYVGVLKALVDFCDRPQDQTAENEVPPPFSTRVIEAESGRAPTAVEWFERHWQKGVQQGLYSGQDIRRVDPKFYQALASGLRLKGQKLSDVLPPSPKARVSELSPADKAERQRDQARSRAKRYRQRHAPHPK